MIGCRHPNHFKLQTDHKPLLTLFNESKAVSPQASGRIQRWALILASYEYTIVCRTTTQHANADAMSRLPLPDIPVQTPVSGELVLRVERLEDAPISVAQIATWTRRDPLLSRVLRYIREGWTGVSGSGNLLIASAFACCPTSSDTH